MSQSSSSALAFSMDFTRGNFNISFHVKHELWSNFLKEHGDFIADIVIKTFDYVDLPKLQTSDNYMDLHFICDNEIQALNHEWRQMDKATNVLSFPNFDDITGQKDMMLQFPELHFGDILIAYEYCHQEAISANIPFLEHISHMVIHGLLHILGYDHIIDSEAAQMEKIEIILLESFGFLSPY